MPTFRVKAQTSQGSRKTLREMGETEAAVRKRLREGGLFVTSIKAEKNPASKVHNLKLSNKELVEILLQLEIQLGAGTFLEEALETIKDDFPSRKGRFFLRTVHMEIANSVSNFTGALEKFPRTFPSNILTVLKSGEQRGTPELALKIKEVRERILYVSQIRKQVIWAMTYPICVGLLGSGLLIFLQAGLFPRLISMLTEMGVKKFPPITLFAIGMSHFFVRWWPFLAAALVGVPIGAVVLQRFKATALIVDKAILNMPLFGNIYKLLTTALIFRIYKSLWSDGRDPILILDLCSELSPNRAIRAGLERTKASLMSGEPLEEAFRKAGYFPPIAVTTIKAARRSGTLQIAMEFISQAFTDLAKEKISVAVGVFTWTFFLVIAAMVGITVLGFFSAVYFVVQSIH